MEANEKPVGLLFSVSVFEVEVDPNLNTGALVSFSDIDLLELPNDDVADAEAGTRVLVVVPVPVDVFAFSLSVD